MKKILLVGSLFLCGLLNAADFPRILIKIPTRSRPEQFFRQLSLYYQKLSRQVPCSFLITCDEDDKTMNNPEVVAKLKSFENLEFHYGKPFSKIEAYNRDIEKHDFDILVLASDDMEPVIKGYDLVIAQKMMQAFPDFDGVLHFNDGNDHLDCNTLPIIGKRFYDSFGYAYFPGYKSFCCDNEITLVSRIFHKELICPEVIIQHNHPWWGRGKWDQLYDECFQEFENDKKILSSRLACLFGISKEQLRATKRKDWSILICTQRQDGPLFKRLYNKLRSQIAACNLDSKIEVLVSFADNSSDSRVKRKNLLLAQSQGYYVSFLEDSIDISDSYIATIHDKFKNDADVIIVHRGRRRAKGTDIQCAESVRDACRNINSRSALKRHIAVLFMFTNDSDETERTSQLLLTRLIRSEEECELPLIWM